MASDVPADVPVDPRDQRPESRELGPMAGRISRFREMLSQPSPMMFIDSPLPHHQRLNYAVIGDTASENPSFAPMINLPHRFQVGMVKAEPGNGPAYHTHDYVECFMPLTEHRWRFYWGEHEDRVDGEAVLEKWDFISLPPRLWRGFEVLPGETGTAWMSAVLDPHDVFTFKDPYWSPYVSRAAAAMGYEADDAGRMVRVPDDHAQREREVLERIGSRE